MPTLWFCIVAVMLTAYVLLDGFDLGVGIIHLIAARSDSERSTMIRSIGPVWDGNEVWLLAAGGTLYFAFPGLYASGFSGFYLALMIVLWLLMLRGIAVEFRSHIRHQMWGSFWDIVFSGASLLLAIFYGTALGNVVRGVPLDKDGYFFVPLWTTFRTGPEPGILDWYTVMVGVAALFVLTMHGALWINLKTCGKLQETARRIASTVYWAVCAAVVAITVCSFLVQPQLEKRFTAYPLLWVFPLLAAFGLLLLRLALSASLHFWAFIGSALFIAGLLCSAAFGLFPLLLPSSGDASLSLTVLNSAAPDYGLSAGLKWWIPAFALAVTYSVLVYRHFRGKVLIPREGSDAEFASAAGD
ncbi:MAG TPA: cytochrome d ubiquinol oxidase subunit II [Bryobacteraceae bacterium]|nr:cytochrome d ubiquinol oxidase subunit II [Bryobacteraceae bacterium]